MENITKKQFTNGAIWKIVESYSAKGISMIVSIILARILLPSDYGVISLTQIFLNLSDILIDGGFSTSLIRKKEVDDEDYSSVLIVSFSIAAILYVIFFASAPFVANYYSEPLFSPVLRVLGLTLFIQAFTSTREAIVNRNMQFKVLCFCNITGSTISGIIGIALAYLGFGVWSLVVQRLLQTALVTGLLLLKVRFRIKWSFNVKKIKEILKFSIGVVSASLVYFVGNNMYSAVIGKQFSVTDLGYYGKGVQLPEQISLYTFSGISSALLPTISSSQNDIHRVKHVIRKVTAFTAFIIFPLMMGLALASNELIIILFTNKWLPAAPVMIGYCIYYSGMPFTLINSQVYYALGHSFTKLKVEVIRIIMMAIGLILGLSAFNCNIAELSMVSGCIMLVAAVISAIESSKMLRYSLKEVFSDLWKPVVSTIFMDVVIIIATNVMNTYNIKNSFIRLIVKFIIGVVSYFGASCILKCDGINDTKEILQSIIHRK